MDVQIEEVSSIRRKLSFSIPADQVDAEIGKAYKKIAKTAKVKGFRKGKVPQNLLEQYYGSEMREQVVGRLVNDSYFKALTEHEIPAVSNPQIVDSGTIEKGQAYTYAAEVEVRPEVEVRDYSGLKLQKEKFVAEEGIVDKRLEEMQAARSELAVSKRKTAKDGDFTTIDFEGFVDGVAFAGGKAENHQLELGSGTFIPGFEEQIVGMKVDQEKDVEVTFPEEYGNEDLAGKPAVFKVVLKEIKEKKLPKLDADFAKEHGAESMADLKKQLEEAYVASEQSRIDNDLRERMMNELIEKNPCEVPAGMVDSQLEYMLGNIRARMQQQGMTMEMLGMNEESFAAMYRETAVKQVQGSLILEGIARQEEIEVGDADFDEKLEKIAEMSQAPLETVKKYYMGDEAKSGLMAQVKEEKAIEVIMAKAKIKEVPKEKLEEQDKKEKE
ncbi:MAG: trigger factor [Desulfuromonas sp.]|nr:MAG: trigger factor [Desulfuromonas sp.]